jgi:transcription antitermination factor NusG
MPFFGGDLYFQVDIPEKGLGTMALSWYILRSKPNKEEFFWGQLIAHFIEVYYPCIRAKVVSPRTYKDKPFFPGHLFIYIDILEITPSFLEWLPGSRGLVMNNAQPILVPDTLIASIHYQVDQINAGGREAVRGRQAGELFKMQESFTAGYETIFDSCLSGNERVHRLLDLLRGERSPVELTGVVRI